MRITFITSKINLLTAGGSVPDLDLKARTLQAAGHQVRVVTVFSKGNKLDRAFPYPILEEFAPPNSLWSSQKGVFDLMRKYEADTDLFHTEGQFMYAGGAYRLFGGRIPVIAFFNRELISWPGAEGTTWSLKQRARYAVERYALTLAANRIDGSIFTSPSLKEAYRRFGYRGEPSLTLPDFVDFAKVRRSIGLEAPRVKERLQARHPFTFVCSGRMIPEKGFDLVIRAAAILKDEDDFRVIMSGGGPEETNLRTFAEECGVKEKIHFVGWIEKPQLLAHLNEADVFILPRWRIELTSVLLFEAMAFATPSIVPAGGGLAWLTGDAASTFPDGNAEVLAECMRVLMRDDAKRVERSRSAARKIREWDPSRLSVEMEPFLLAISKNVQGRKEYAK